MSLLKNRVKINVPFSATRDENLRQLVGIIWTSRKNRLSPLRIYSLSQFTTVECRRQPKVAAFSNNESLLLMIGVKCSQHFRAKAAQFSGYLPAGKVSNQPFAACTLTS
jgi:hypothetical protein